MAGGNAQQFDPDAFHQQFVTSGAAPFDPDAFHEQYTSADKTKLDFPVGSYQTKPGGPIENANAPQPVTLGTRVGNAARWMEDQLPAAGMVAGGLLGSAEPGGGNIAGAALGGAAGTALKRVVKSQPTNTQGAVDIGMGAAQGAGAEMGGQVIGKGIEIVAPAAGRLLSRTPSLKGAQSLYERGVVPSGLSAEDQALMRENFQRAGKYIAPETRDFPIKTGVFNSSSSGGSMRSAGIAHRAADNLWQRTVEPIADTYKDVQRPGDTIAGAIRDSFTPLDQQTKSGAVDAGNKLAEFFEGRPITVGEMKNLATQLNNDRAVARFYDMSPNEQAAAELADPSLRAKVAALHGIRESMFDAIGETGGEELGDGFREARKDWGALRSIENQVRGARVPTPMPWWTKAANTVRGSISPQSKELWLRGSDTLFNFNNPDRLIPKSFNELGRTDLQPPELKPTSPPVGGVPSRTLPPAGGSQPSNPRAVPGVRDPSFEGRPYGETNTATPPIEVQPNSTRILTPEREGDARRMASTIKPIMGTVQNVPGAPPGEAIQMGPQRPAPAATEGEFTDLPRNLEGVNVLPTSGRTMVTPRPRVEVLPGFPELPTGPPAAPGRPELKSGLPERALPEINPRHPVTGAIQIGPSQLPTSYEYEKALTKNGMDSIQAHEQAIDDLKVIGNAKNYPEAASQMARQRIDRAMSGEKSGAPKSPGGKSPAEVETERAEARRSRNFAKSSTEPVDVGKPAPAEPAKPLTAKQVQLAKMEDRPAAAKTPRTREPKEQLQKFDEDTLATAKAELEEANGKWQTFERPNRYHLDLNAESGREAPIKGADYVYGVPSARPQMEAAHPWLKNLPKITAEKLRAAIESGKGVEYTRLLNEAGKHIEATKASAGPILEEYAAKLEDAAKSAEAVDPDLARMLRDAAAGKYSGMTGLRSFIEARLHEAEAAAGFDKTISELSAEELSSGAEESAGHSDNPREADQQAVELGPQSTLPGLEGAVAENKKMATVELGKKLTEKINEPAKSIESAAGEMESKSPLFRGTGASPQNEMFAPGGAAKELTTADYDRQAHDYREQVRNHETVSPNKYATFQHQEETLPRSAKDRAAFWKRTLDRLSPQASGKSPQSIVESAGAKFVGIQKGYGLSPDRVLFQATPEGSSMSIDLDKFSADALKKRLSEAGNK
jgi:hypothetical protein